MVGSEPLRYHSSPRSASNLVLILLPEVKRHIPHPEWTERHLRSRIHLFQTSPTMSKVFTHDYSNEGGNKRHTISGKFEYLFALIGDPG